jgi:hypothetical protein
MLYNELQLDDIILINYNKLQQQLSHPILYPEDILQ